MEQSTDPKQHLKGLLKQAAHAVDPGKAVHSELTAHTDLMETGVEKLDEIKKTLSKPLQVEVTNHPETEKLLPILQEIKASLPKEADFTITNGLLQELIAKSNEPLEVTATLILE